MLAKASELLVAIAAFCVAIVLLGAGMATADPTGSPTVGTIYLVKYDKAELETDPTGAQEQKLPPGAAPIEGITFQLTPVLKAPGIADVAKSAVTAQDIAQLGKLTAAQVESAFADPGNNHGWEFGKSLERTTDSEGATAWEDIPLGVYLLQETKIENPVHSYHRSPSSLVFLPTSDPIAEPKNTRWLMRDGKYVTWIYPKNSVEENVKTVVDDGIELDGKLTYTVAMSVPAVRELSVKGSYNLNDFGLWDNLDESLAFHQGDEVTVDYEVDSNKLKSLDAEDFVVKVFDDATQSPDDPTADKTGQKVVIALKSSGLNKVAAAKKDYPDTRVFISFKPTLKHVGVVPNKARVYKSFGSDKGLVENPNVEIPFNPPAGPDTSETNTVVSAWGKVNITKTGTPAPGAPGFGEGAVRLSDAKFELYEFADGKQPKQKGSEGSTDKDGKLTFDVVQASDLRNGMVTDSVKYGLLETQAPFGYQLLAEPVPVSLNAAQFRDEANWVIDDNGVVTLKPDEEVATQPTSVTQADLEAWDKGQEVPVTNAAVEGQLPSTGGPGVGLFFVCGGVFLGGAWLTRRRKA